MPNLTGGKNYKKSKHSSATAPRFEEAKGSEGEQYGRVVKLLGNLNMQVYCQDNILRLCKVRGSMRKRVYVNLGDLVIISLREYVSVDYEEDRKGDIVYKYDQTLLSNLKKIEGINPRLFLKLETMDLKDLREFSTKKFDELDNENDCGIVFESDTEEEEGEGEGEGNEKTKKDKIKKQAKESKQAKQTMEDDTNDDVNIDDI